MANSSIVGTPDRDVLTGTDGKDSIFGQAGEDLLQGKSGNDLLDGEEGNDGLLGGAGKDTLKGGAGDDVLDGDGDLSLFGLTDYNTIVAFDPSNPSQASSIEITGVDGTLVGIDVRPANGLLYGVTDASKIYTIDPTTGSATFVSTLSPISFAAGVEAGVDFNPVPDRLRLVGSNDQNLRINVDNGAIADFDAVTPGFQPDLNLTYAADDRNGGADPTITAAAYTNSFFGPAATTRTTQLFGIDSALDTLVLQNPPNNGVLRTIGSLGIDFGATGGFDIFSPLSGVNAAYAVSGSTLYSLDLSSGAATNLGSVGDSYLNLIGLAANLVQVGGGNDSLQGGDGNDLLRGGAGNDVLQGENGNDTLNGGTGDDRLRGGDGNDSILGGAGDDILRGENGGDLLDGAEGYDLLDGGDGDDTLKGGDGDDMLRSANGNDLLDGNDGDDVLDSGDGNDLLRGGSDNDTLNAKNGNDALLGGGDSDILRGGSGDDLLDGDGQLQLFGLTAQNTIVAFDPSNPIFTSSVSVTGVDGTLIGIDVRPANGLLYGVTDTSKIYTIDPTTGSASFVSTLSPLTFNAGVEAGVDFNPVPDRLRLVGSNDQNLRVNVDNGAIAPFDAAAPFQPDLNLTYATDDRNAGANPTITAAAYTNSFSGPAAPTRTTQLFGIDSALDTLVLQNPPNNGVLRTIGSLGVDFGATGGFDIFSPLNGLNIAYAVSGSTLYSLDLSTGAATSLGSVGNGSSSFIGLAATIVQEKGDSDRLLGGDGNDTLTGGVGDDVLSGGAGSDQFVFNSSTAFDAAGLGVDRVRDFEVSVDKIVLDKTTFTALQSVVGGGFSVAAEFTTVDSDDYAAGSDALIVYSRGSGNLFYNSDGAEYGFGSGAQFATLQRSLLLTASDFQIAA
ncbi:DUF4394 domain-containing protein [Leptolyngbya sp. FACHB-36]|uniref:DUF4394 domain-containing protein n=1 Tax=Leptolyngbya sp. FACHB-36 TaxID=2692808 RepID=UPI001681A687|nr:DUF4394 domain-containing protein [Leptolyngbya sp. FACHB-36]MBD2021651.1 DUF4394 domain-containing protein [Leptolyngbya sp. FACHB-36]